MHFRPNVPYVVDGADNLLMRFEYADARMPVAMEKGGALYYLAYDQVGSLRMVADAAGNVVEGIATASLSGWISDLTSRSAATGSRSHFQIHGFGPNHSTVRCG